MSAGLKFVKADFDLEKEAGIMKRLKMSGLKE